MAAITFSSTKFSAGQPLVSEAIHQTILGAGKMPLKEFYLDRVLEEMKLSHDEFIDLCILLGCDYCDSIRGIGPKRAVELISQHRNIKTITKHLDTKKYLILKDWPYEAARQLFRTPEVTEGSKIELKWNEPDEAELIRFMCEEKGFNEERIRNGCKKLKGARNTTTQGRLDSFFKVTSVTSTKKRKSEDGKGSKSAKKAKTGSFKRPK